MLETECNDCPLHDNIKTCLAIIKIDVKDIERKAENVGERLSAIEPTIEHHEKAILVIQKLQMGTLVSALTSAVGIISALAYLWIRHLG